MYVYLITNLVNGKKYVGQTIRTVGLRFRSHCWPSTRTNMPITLAIRKYGKENFKVEVLEVCRSQEELDEREIHHATGLNAFAPHGYNLRAGNGRGCMTDELKQRIREKALGRKVSDETRSRLSRSHLGIGWSDDHKRTMSARLRGVRPAESCRKGASEKNAKTYSLTSPEAKRMTVTNMRAFCQEMGLGRSEMSNLVRGRLSSYRGWRAALVLEDDDYRSRPRPRSPKAYKSYRFTDPHGNTVEIQNLQEYCRENGLSYTGMIDVAGGRMHHHRGWTRPAR